jgi:hypothetical protein
MASDPAKEMLSAAMAALKPELQRLQRDGVAFDERVWFLADATEEPGRTLGPATTSS